MKPLTMTKLSLRSLFRKPVTEAYPVIPRTYFEATRGRILIEQDKCTLCVLCQMRCPTGAITVDRTGKTWSIDRLRCIQCGACIEACPRNCLANGNQYTESATEKTIDSVDVPYEPPARKKPPEKKEPTADAEERPV